MVDITTAFISTATAVLAGVLSYVLTKRAEREAEWRKEKLNRYKTFIGSLSGILENESSHQEQKQFARACNDLLLFAPQSVIDALHRFQDEIGASNHEKSAARHDALLSHLLLAIRRDLKIRPRDKADSFQARLWASSYRKTRR